MRKHSICLLIVLTLGVALQASVAVASPPFDLLGDVGSSGGLQARTTPGGSAAAYFNPALLADTPAGVTLGFMVLNQRIGIRTDGRPGTEFAVPEGLENSGHADSSRFDSYAIPTNLLQFGRTKDARHEAFLARPRQGAGSGHSTLTYEVFGLVVKLFDDRVGIGFHALVPNGEFTKLRAFWNDEREQYFSNSLHPELYSDRMTALSLAPGVGFKVAEGLSLGIGATIALAANVVAPTYVVDTGNLGKILIDMNASVNIGIAPHFGASYQIGDRVRLSASVHTPQRIELGTSFTFLLGNGIEQSSGVSFVLGYTPWQIALGGTLDLLKSETSTLSLAATALYARWSSYVDRHGDRPVPAYAWADTLSPSLGLRWRLRAVTTWLDATYVPTPVPDQTGRSNYVDNDRVGGILGADYRFPLFGTEMKLGASFQLHGLMPRYQRKLNTPTVPEGTVVAPDRVKDELPDDAQLSGEPVAAAKGLQTNNPGWPGFSSGGFILAGSLYLTVTL